MKNKCLTSKCFQDIRYVVMGVLSIILLSGSLNQVQAQCPLACNDLVQVSVDVNCTAEITPDVVLEAPGLRCNYVVTLYDENDVELPDDTVRYEHVGTTVKAKVTLDGNSCWSYIQVEDKIAPVVQCSVPDTVMCNVDVYNISPDTVYENCTDYTEVVLSDKFYDWPCDSAFSGVRVICRYYVDSWGNRSDTCCHEILFTRPTIDEIVLPEDTLFSCTDFPGADPSITGVPTWNGIPIYPDRGYCEINVTYSDDTIDICPASYKIIREWIVLDWCTPTTNGNPLLGFQIIKVVDEEGPELYCPTTVDTVSSDLWTCTGTYILPVPIRLDSPNQVISDPRRIYIIDDCSEVTYSVSHLPATNPNDCTPGGGFPNQNNVQFDRTLNRWVATNLPHGCNWFYYEFTDECGNTSTCAIDVYVVDDAPPVAVCDEHTIAALGIDGIAKVYARSLDDGSWDNCEIDYMRARRMDGGIPCGDTSYQYTEYIEFCCADEGQSRMVEFVVWDKAGNSNSCMVEVEVQDKMPPQVTCPPDITVSCDFDLSDLSVFGTIVNAKFNQVRKPIVIDDPYVKFGGPAFDGEYYDNCLATFRVEEDNQVECGNGFIYRTFIVSDKNGLETRCTQRIYVHDYEPFEVLEDHWPEDYTNTTDCVNGINLDPSETGDVDIVDEDCGSVFVNYDDQVFTLEPDACLKILRKWTVIDWCYYDPNSSEPEGIWRHTQVIKITNNVPPVMVSSCADREVELYGADCTEDVRLTAAATDDCTPEDDLRWTWELDLNDDGIIDTTGTGNDFVINLPPGRYFIRWTVEDQCHNETICEYYFDVVDRKNPTPYCRNGINTVLMESVKTIEIWASDFNVNSEDNCTAKEDLRYAFLINGRFESSMTFDCNDLGIQTIQVYVIDEEGNYDYCETQVDIQDPNDLCGGTGNLVSVGGNIQTASGEDMANVDVSLVKISNNVTQLTTTNSNGDYAFNSVPTFSSYKLSVEKNDDPLNGVSTKDLVFIQRYLLGMQPLAGAYQHIAADANNNQEVTAGDIAELRKLILGATANFRYGQKSWRFVDADQTLDPDYPFPFAEEIGHYDLSGSRMNSNFVAVKIGDINGDAEGGLNGLSTRSGLEDFVLSVDNVEFEAGTTIEVPVYAEASELLGLQMTLEMNNAALSAEGIISGQLEICDDCFTVSDEGIAMSWYSINSIELNDDQPLFVLILSTKDNGELAQQINVTSNVTVAEAYSDIDDIKNVKLNVNGQIEAAQKYELYQNVPNPFMSSTAIGFDLPRAQDVKLTIFDINGKVHQVFEGHFEKGYHEFVIESDKLNVEGVLYYQLNAGTFTSTRKMLMLR